MNCKLCRDRLQDYLDATLEAAEQAQVSAHLAQCEACRRELDELRKVVALVGSLDEVPEPMGFLQAVRERIDRPTVWERIRGLLTQPPRPGVSVAIPVIIIAFVGVFVLTNLLPKSQDQKADDATPGPKGDVIARDMRSPEEKLKTDADDYKYESLAEADGAGDEGRLEDADGPANGLEKDRTRTRGPEGVTAGDVSTDEGGKFLDSVGTDTFADAEPGSGERREGVEKEVDSTSGTTLLGMGGGREDTTSEIADSSEKATRNGSSITTAADDDIGHEEAVEQEENGKPVWAAGIRGPHGAERGKQEFQLQPGDEEMNLVIFDLGTDLMGAGKIAREHGGRVIVQRERDLIKGLLLFVPDENFDEAVEKLHLYNDKNRQALERRRTAVAKDAESGPQRLRLIIRRFIEGMDNQ